MSADRRPSADRIREIISASSPADYDGHTEFEQMTPAQRLEWLDHAVTFIASTKDAKSAGNRTAATLRPSP